VARCIFDIFRKDSSGSFYHAYRILEVLLRCFPAEVYEGICADGLVTERMANLLSHVGYAPICELAVMLIALTPVARTSQLYVSSCKARWRYFEELSQWNLMYRITKVMVNPDEHCVHDNYVTLDQHTSAASQLMQELVEKLSLEDSGEILLQPFGYTMQLLDALIDTSIDSNKDDGLRRCTTKLICFLLRRAAEAEIMCFVNNPQSNNGNAPIPPTATYIPNRLFPLRARIVNHIRERIPEITNCIMGFESDSLSASDAIKYSSYEIQKPFSSLRSFIVEMLVLMVESDETVASLIPVELWKLFINWALKYAHNNIYHALFYRLIFAVLRQGQEGPQKILFQKAKFALFLIDNFIQYPLDGNFNVSANTPVKGNSEYDLYVRRIASRGLIMNCANAIRLQASCQPPTSFLSSFLSTHAKWNEFLPQLTLGTDVQMKFGMGITIASVEQTASRMSNMLMYISEPKPDSAIVDEIDHGSRFAKSLGFYEEAQWSFAAPEPPPVAISEQRRKRREKRRKSEDIDDGRLSFEDDAPDLGRLSGDSSDSTDEGHLAVEDHNNSPTKSETHRNILIDSDSNSTSHTN